MQSILSRQSFCTMSFSKEDFQQDYEKYGTADLASQLPHLRKLADVYLEKCRKTNHWMDYIKVHGLLNSCKQRMKDVDEITRIESEIYNVENEYYIFKRLQYSLSFEEWKTMTLKHKDQLKKNRVKAKAGFKTIDSEVGSKIDMDDENIFNEKNMQLFSDFASQVNRESKSCTDDMILFTKQLCIDSESMVGHPPCSYEVIALGSIARGEATPYSDLEYAFMVENDEKKNVDYFFNLAIDSYFRIANLGETPLKYFYINELLENDAESSRYSKPWFEDEAMSGFKIDGFTPWAGNIPTGNGGRKLISTPAQLMKLYKECFDNESIKTEKTGDDSHLLSGVVLIYHYPEGDPCLLEKFLAMRRRFEEKMKKSPGVVKKRLTTLREDIERYDYSPGITSNIANNPAVKTDIFRYPTLLAHDLKFIFSLYDCESAQQVFESLRRESIISEEIHGYFQFILMAAIWIRTSAYLNSDTQRESISFYPQIADEENADDRFYVPMKLYVPMTCCLTPIKKHMKDSLEPDAVQYSYDRVRGSLSSLKINKTDFFVRCKLHYACGDSYGGLEHVKKALELEIDKNEPEELVKCIKRHSLADEYKDKEYLIVQLVSHMLLRQTKFKVAERYLVWLFKTLTELAKESSCNKFFQRNAAACHYLKSQCLLMLGKHVDAHKSFLETRQLFTKFYNNEGAKITTLDIMSKAFDDLWHKRFGEGELEVFAMVFSNIQIIFDTIRFHRGSYRGFNVLVRIVRKFEERYASECPSKFHPALGYLCLSVAVCYDFQYANFVEAEEYLNKAKKHFEICFGKAAVVHETVATLVTHATLCIHKGEYADGERICKDALDKVKLLTGSSHLVFNCHQNLALIYFYTEKFADSLEQLQISKNIIDQREERSDFHFGILHMIYAEVYYAKGSLSQAKNSIKLSIEFFKETFRIRRKVYKITTHPDIAEAHRISAQIDLALGNKDSAKKSIEEAVFGLEQSFGKEIMHLSIAEAYHVKALLKQKEGDFSEATKLCKKTINMVKEKFGNDTTHLSLKKYERLRNSLCDSLGKNGSAHG